MKNCHKKPVWTNLKHENITNSFLFSYCIYLFYERCHSNFLCLVRMHPAPKINHHWFEMTQRRHLLGGTKNPGSRLINVSIRNSKDGIFWVEKRIQAPGWLMCPSENPKMASCEWNKESQLRVINVSIRNSKDVILWVKQRIPAPGD